MIRCLGCAEHACLRSTAFALHAAHPERQQPLRNRNLVYACARSSHRYNGAPRETATVTPASNLRYRDADGKPKAAMYDHFLGLQIKLRPHRGSPWVHELDHAACLQALPQHLQADPLACFQQQDADIRLAELAMEAFVAGQHKQASITEARASIIERRAGCRVLLWLIRHPNYQELDVSLHPRFLRAMIHCLVAEGDTENLTDWLLVDVNRTELKNHYRVARAWKGWALRSFLEDTTFWAGNNINPAIVAYEHFIRLARTPHGIEIANFVPKHHAGTWLQSQLRDGDNGNVQPYLYDAVIRSIHCWVNDPLERLYSRAELKLVHPTNPSAEDALKFVMEILNRSDNSGYIGRWLKPPGRYSSYRTYWFLVMLAQFVGKHRGRRDAEAVLDFAVSTVPDLFIGR